MTTKTNGSIAEVKAGKDHIDRVQESPALNNVKN